MARFLLFSLLSYLAIASPLPQSQQVPSGACCFNLQDGASKKTVQQGVAPFSGELYFNGGFANGWYCVEPSTNNKLLWDEKRNTCFINSSQQFLCHDPTPSDDQWALAKQGSSRLLTRNGDTTFLACPAPNGAERLYWAKKADKSGCRNVQLKAQNLKGACS
jgi:hypothetical protein